MRPVGRCPRLPPPPPFAPADGRVDGERAVERGADGDVEHAGAHDEDGAAECVRAQQVLDANSIALKKGPKKAQKRDRKSIC